MENLDEVPVALNKKGQPIKTGHKDINKRIIRNGDLFVLSREKKTGHPFRIIDLELAQQLYGNGPSFRRFSGYSQRRHVNKEGRISIRVWKDEPATIYKKLKSPNASGVNYSTEKSDVRKVGAPKMLRPGMFGIILGRHELRPSQWHAIIGNKHYSVSNVTMHVIRGEDEFKMVQENIGYSNRNISKEEWESVMRASVAK